MNLQKYGQEFYDRDVTVTRLLCLDLLDNADPFAADQVEEITEDLDVEEYAALFGFSPDEFDGEISDISHEYVLEIASGWIVAAKVMIPHGIRFDPSGRLEGYSGSTSFRLITVYKRDLNEALSSVSSQADLIRKEIFAKARKEQGLPEPAADPGTE